jgi:hypothetical protein
MGFGEKTDYQSKPQRVLNLDKTYNNIIKPVVIEAGLECLRADEVIHSTVIDKPMYDNLLSADLVIADLSTSNANAIYELGVRHALRPRRTIVMAESKFRFPFDLNHLSILKYEHLGKEIGFDEVINVRDELKKRIVELMDSPEADSPVFLFIPSLTRAGLQRAGLEAMPQTQAAAIEPPKDDKSFAELLESFRTTKAAVKKAADWAVPSQLLRRLEAMQPHDPYVLQQLALATYKFEQPDKKSALMQAKGILEKLTPEASSDAETVGLWGAIHKRLWELSANHGDLNESIRAYGRGFYIRNDYYNGINYAFMLNVRASSAVGDEAVADRVLASRMREEVLVICDRRIQMEASGAQQQSGSPGMDPRSDEQFWIGATKVEALFGLRRNAEAVKLKTEVVATEQKRLIEINVGKQCAIEEGNRKEQMLNDQLAKLEKLLPPVPERAGLAGETESN